MFLELSSKMMVGGFSNAMSKIEIYLEKYTKYLY